MRGVLPEPSLSAAPDSAFVPTIARHELTCPNCGKAVFRVVRRIAAGFLYAGDDLICIACEVVFDAMTGEVAS